MGRILQLLDANPGRELECFDWHFGRRSVGRSPCCAPPFPPTSAACKPSGKSLYGLVDSDVQAARAAAPMHTSDLLDLLTPRGGGGSPLPELGTLFQELADGFFDEPNRAPIWAGPPAGFSWT